MLLEELGSIFLICENIDKHFENSLIIIIEHFENS